MASDVGQIWSDLVGPGLESMEKHGKATKNHEKHCKSIVKALKKHCKSIVKAWKIITKTMQRIEQAWKSIKQVWKKHCKNIVKAPKKHRKV